MKRLPSKLVRTAPKRIWLQCGDDPENLRCNFIEMGEVTWCKDSVMASEVEYIRADLRHNVQAETAALDAWEAAQTPHGGEMESERTAWVVYTNTDLTEGRGWQFPLHVCDKEATAIRLAHKAGVMGSDAEVKAVSLVKAGGAWYGPVQIKQATKEDDHAQKMMDERRAAIARARELGLSDEDIRLLRAG